MGAKQSAEMRNALRLIFEQNKSAAEASRQAGVSKGAISQNPDYRKWKDAKDAAKRKAVGAA